jgi:hypothetical protein
VFNPNSNLKIDMDSHKLVVKLFADAPESLPLEAVVPVFHAWIRDQSVADHLLIDVADYAHVPNGPGTVLVAHEANIHFDHEDGAGLMYVRKQPIEGATNLRERLTAVLRAAIQCATKLENDPTMSGIRFRTSELMFRVNDRLVAPNEESTYRAIAPDLQAVFAELYQGDVAMEHKHDAERLFEVRVKATGKPMTFTNLLSRLEPAATPA